MFTTKHFVNPLSLLGNHCATNLKKDTTVKQKETRFSRQLKNPTFHEFQINEQSDGAAFKTLLAEKKRLSCLAHNIDQKYDTLCDVLCSRM